MDIKPCLCSPLVDPFYITILANNIIIQLIVLTLYKNQRDSISKVK